MRKNNLGFTLGEVLVSLAIIGIIMALASHTIKLAKSSYTAVSYHALNNVKMIVGELIAGERVALSNEIDSATGRKKELPLAQMKCRVGNNGMVTTILAPDYRSHTTPLCREAGKSGSNGGNGTPDTLFCQNTVYFANTNGKVRCDFNDHFEVDKYNSTTKEPKIIIDEYNPQNPTKKSWGTPNFIATNGYRYYFSKWKYDENVSIDYGFRIIAVDINGKNGPNKTDFDANTEILPDIVQFLVLDNGEIYPIGPAGNNLKVKDKTVTYLNTRVKGYYYRDDPGRKNNVPSSCTQRTKDKDGNIVEETTCNYAVLYSQNSKGDSFFSYKEAYCYALGNKLPTYVSYCDNFPYDATDNLCPPTTHDQQFDHCDIAIIKPMFRYNLK